MPIMSTTAAATSERFVLTTAGVPRCKNGQLSTAMWVWSRWWLSRVLLWAVAWNRNERICKLTSTANKSRSYVEQASKCEH